MAFNSSSSLESSVGESGYNTQNTGHRIFDGPEFNSWRASENERFREGDEGPLVPGFADNAIRESQRRNNLAPGIFAEDLFVCRTCPMSTTHRYFLRQPRSWGSAGSPSYEAAERRRRGPANSASTSSGYGLSSSSSSSSSTAAAEETGLPTDTELDDSVFRPRPSPPRVMDAPEDDSLTRLFGNLKVRPRIQIRNQVENGAPASSGNGSPRPPMEITGSASTQRLSSPSSRSFHSETFGSPARRGGFSPRSPAVPSDVNGGIANDLASSSGSQNPPTDSLSFD